jgi:putative tricarboxylic transport membrane protein
MQDKRRGIHIGSMALGLLSALAMAVSAGAQSFPSRPIEVVAHTSAGSGTDLFARTISDIMTKEKIITQPFTISNRVGGAGAIAYNYVKGKRGDPHVLLTIGTGTFLSAVVRPETELNLTHFTPLALFALDPQAVAVRAESKIKTFKDRVETLKREPNSMSAAVTSAVGTGRYALYLIERETNSKFKVVTFKGGADAVLATLGGHVEVTTENLSEMLSLYESKKMRVLALTGEQRFARAPEIPTLKELGYNIIAATGRGFAMPAGVPKESATVMETALKRAHDTPAYKEFSERNIFEDRWMGSAEFTDYLNKRLADQQTFLKSMGALK